MSVPDSLFEKQGFSLRFFSTKDSGEMYEVVRKAGIKHIVNALQLCVIGIKGWTYSKYQNYSSRVLYTVMCGVNEMEYLEEINRFVRLAKENGYHLEALIGGETYDYETTPLVYLEQAADVFSF